LTSASSSAGLSGPEEGLFGAPIGQARRGKPRPFGDKLARDTYEEHELRKSLLDMVFHEQVLLFAAGILWEQASGGRRKLLPGV
jgi:hypothetical protein